MFKPAAIGVLVKVVAGLYPWVHVCWINCGGFGRGGNQRDHQQDRKSETKDSG